MAINLLGLTPHKVSRDLSGYITYIYGAEKSGKTFFEVLKTHEKEFADITAQLEKLGIENPANFFENPANYCGLAAVKSKRLAQKYRDLMKK